MTSDFPDSNDRVQTAPPVEVGPETRETHDRPERWWRSVAVQCCLAVSAVLAVGFAVMHLFTFNDLKTRLSTQFETYVGADASAIALSLAPSVLAGIVPETALASIIDSRESPIVGLRAVSARQQVLSEILLPGAVARFDPVAAGSMPTDTVRSGIGNGAYLVRIPLMQADGRVSGLIEILYSEGALAAATSRTARYLTAAQIITMLLASLAVLFVLRTQVTRPLVKVTRAMQAISSDAPGTPLPRAASNEIARIHDSLEVFRARILDRELLAQQAAEMESRHRAEVDRNAGDRAAVERKESERERARMEAAQGRAREADALRDDLHAILSDAAKGQFGSRMQVEDAPHDQRALREMLNSHLQTLEQGFAEVTAVMSELARGQLYARMQGERLGAFADLQESTNLAAAQFQDAFEDLFRNASEVLDETSDLSASAEELSKRTERTAGSLAETTGALEQITGSITATAKLAQGARGFTNSARDDARQSDEIVQEAIESMHEIQKASQDGLRGLAWLLRHRPRVVGHLYRQILSDGGRWCDRRFLCDRGLCLPCDNENRRPDASWLCGS